MTLCPPRCRREDCRTNATYCQVYLSGLGEKRSKLRCVIDRLVAVAVVHEEMDLLGSASDLADLLEPLLELLFFVRVIKGLCCGQPRLVPVLGVVANEAHDRDCIDGYLAHWGEARRDSVWLTVCERNK